MVGMKDCREISHHLLEFSVWGVLALAGLCEHHCLSGAVWGSLCCAQHGETAAPQGKQIPGLFPKAVWLVWIQPHRFPLCTSFVCTGFKHMCQKLIYSDPSTPRVDCCCLVWWRSRRLRWHLGTRGCWVRVGGTTQPLRGGRGTAGRKHCCQRKCLLARLIWKGILPTRGTWADEMRGTFWDLTNMFHYKFGPQTTEGFVRYVFFISQGKLLPLWQHCKIHIFCLKKVHAWN